MASENSYAQLIDDFENGIMVLEDETLSEYIKRMGGVDYNSKADGGLMVAIERFNQGGMAGNKTYHQYHDQYVPMDEESMMYANGGGVGSMMQPKSKTGKAVNQLQAKAPEGEFLAYINPDEAAMLKRAGGSGEPVNGIPSFRPQDMGNAANQAASAANTGAGGGSRSNNNKNNNDGPRGPAELGTSTRTVNRITAPEAYEIIGGQRFNVNPNTTDERNRARVKQEILNAPLGNRNSLNKTGIFSGGFNPFSLIAGIFGGPLAGLLTRGIMMGKDKIIGLNDSIQNSDFGRSTSLADYFDAKKYGGIDARDAAAKANMADAKNITNRISTDFNPRGPNEMPAVNIQGLNNNDYEGEIGAVNNNDFVGLNTNATDMQNYITDQASFTQPGITPTNLNDFEGIRSIPQLNNNDYQLGTPQLNNNDYQLGTPQLNNNDFIGLNQPGITPTNLNDFIGVNQPNEGEVTASLPGNNIFAGNYSQNAVGKQLYGKEYDVLTPFEQQQIDKAIDTIGTRSNGQLARNGGIMGYGRG